MDFLHKWMLRAKQLRYDESELKKTMEPGVVKAVGSKRVLFFEEMLLATQFPDLGLVDDLVLGAELTGQGKKQ